MSLSLLSTDVIDSNISSGITGICYALQNIKIESDNILQYIKFECIHPVNGFSRSIFIHVKKSPLKASDSYLKFIK